MIMSGKVWLAWWLCQVKCDWFNDYVTWSVIGLMIISDKVWLVWWLHYSWADPELYITVSVLGWCDGYN